VLALTAFALFFILFARQWPLLKSTWPAWAPPVALLGLSGALATAEWAWFRSTRATLPCRVAAALLWLGAWPYVHNWAFWGLGMFLMAASGWQKKELPSSS
jgi:hypothetical protein